jgi:hypothetical protein
MPYTGWWLIFTLTLHNFDLTASVDNLDIVAFIVPMLDACRWMLDNLNSTGS